MSQPYVASVQYGDFNGTVSIDGHDHSLLSELRKHSEIPAGYLPVGFNLYRLMPDKEGNIPFQIAAANCKDAGDSLAEICKRANREGRLTVRMFDGKFPAKLLDSLFNRVDIKVLTKGLSDVPVEYQG